VLVILAQQDRPVHGDGVWREIPSKHLHPVERERGTL